MPKVTILDTGESYECPEDRDLLRGMEALGRKGIPVGCRGGGCGICKIQVQSGSYDTLKMSKAHISGEDRAIHITLACRTFARSDLTIKVIGKMVRVFDPARVAGRRPATTGSTTGPEAGQRLEGGIP